MNLEELKPDTYSLRARLAPAFIVLLPIGLALSAWFPDADVVARTATIVGAPVILCFLLAQTGRDMGSRRQPRLWDRWGGAPTTQLLRHRNAAVNPEIRHRYHQALVALDPSLILPTPDEEARDSAAADHAYEAAVRFALDLVRDKPMVAKENANYGFRRNLWGMRALAIPIVLLSLAAVCVRLSVVGYALTLDWIILTGICVLLLFGWLFWFTPSWVRIPADSFARCVLEASVLMASQRPVV